MKNNSTWNIKWFKKKKKATITVTGRQESMEGPESSTPFGMVAIVARSIGSAEAAAVRRTLDGIHPQWAIAVETRLTYRRDPIRRPTPLTRR